MDFPIKPGSTISRADLHELVGGRATGRVSPSRTTPNVCLFTSPGSHDSQWDGWTGEAYHFQGEGTGDREQAMMRGNRSVAEHAADGRTLRLFSEAPGLAVRYLGAYRLAQDIPHVQVALPVVGAPHQPHRAGIVFRLLPEVGTPVPTGVLAMEPLRTETVVRERDIDLPFRPGPGDERGRDRTVIEETAEQLLRGYSTHLRSLGHDVRRYTVIPAHELVPLPVDLVDHSTNDLVVCLGSVTRPTVRAALGTLVDLPRFFDPRPRRVTLMPSRPRPDLADLCGRNDIAVIWQERDGRFERAEPADLIQT